MHECEPIMRVAAQRYQDALQDATRQHMLQLLPARAGLFSQLACALGQTMVQLGVNLLWYGRSALPPVSQAARPTVGRSALKN